MDTKEGILFIIVINYYYYFVSFEKLFCFTKIIFVIFQPLIMLKFEKFS